MIPGRVTLTTLATMKGLPARFWDPELKKKGTLVSVGVGMARIAWDDNVRERVVVNAEAKLCTPNLDVEPLDEPAVAVGNSSAPKGTAKFYVPVVGGKSAFGPKDKKDKAKQFSWTWVGPTAGQQELVRRWFEKNPGGGTAAAVAADLVKSGFSPNQDPERAVYYYLNEWQKKGWLTCR